MKTLKTFALITILCLLLGSCSDKEDENTTKSKDGAIYGRVTDFATGSPVANANVSLRPGSETTLTGYDGEYEFSNIENGDYYISVSRTEYTDLVDDNIIKINDGNRVRRDLRIKKLPTDLRITDMYGNDINFIDYGSEPSSVVRSFNIFNNGTGSINCNMVYSCAWIKSVTSVPNVISPGQTVTVSVEIDRTKLNAGVNTTNLYITSNNISNVLEIRATGQESIPVVITLPVTNPDGTQGHWMNTFHANVTAAGNPAYTKRGFCWSSSNNIPTINDQHVEIPGNGVGEYNYTWHEIPIPTTAVTYYVRAYVIYGTNNTILYGNVQSFIYNDV